MTNHWDIIQNKQKRKEWLLGGNWQHGCKFATSRYPYWYDLRFFARRVNPNNNSGTLSKESLYWVITRMEVWWCLDSIFLNMTSVNCPRFLGSSAVLGGCLYFRRNLPSVSIRLIIMVGWILAFYILATSKVISGRVSTCDSDHQKRL